MSEALKTNTTLASLNLYSAGERRNKKEMDEVMTNSQVM